MPALSRSGVLAAALLSLSAANLACVQPPAPNDERGEEREKGQGPDPSRAGVGDPGLSAGPDPFVPGRAGDPQLQAQLDAAVAARGPDYQPRAEHLEADGRPTYTNRLILETSPYLLQHAHNPINWFPWGDEVFARAKAEDKPVLLSVGYSTCHWCHVMERESFEDPVLAAYINAHFLAIKVDREQRPDIDEIYMRAVRLLSKGRGGWPMTVLLTPKREPFFGGTYFPPDGRGGRPGFRSMLEQLEHAYREDPEAVVAKARRLSEAVTAQSTPPPSTTLPDAQLIARAAAALGRSYDPAHGGFGDAPKFPRPVELELLLRHARRSGDEDALAWVRGTVDGILSGGIRDHLGGGFHRYSTDATWLVPHFEKMLYDNAQLVVVLLELHQVTGEARYAQVARETLDYLEREMSHADGGFYSATDADSLNPISKESEEGWFFTWTEAELSAALGAQEPNQPDQPDQPDQPPDALLAAVRATYATSAAGNFEGRNIFHTPRPRPAVAAELGIDEATLDDRLARAHARLYALRSQRPPPLRDDKVLSAWNGLAISAFARASFVLDEPRYLDRARAGAEFLHAQHRDGEGRLLRSSLPGSGPGGRAFLDDHAFVIQAYLDLFESSAEGVWLERALALQASLDAHFLDAEGGAYFTTPDDGEALLTRTTPSYDGAEPSGNSVAAVNLLRLHQLTGDASFRARAVALLEALATTATRSPLSAPKLLCALDFLTGRPQQIFVVTPAGGPAPAALVAPLRHTFVPNRAMVVLSEQAVATLQEQVPALELKTALQGRATAYVCEDQVCQKPTSDPELFAAQLARVDVP